MVAAKKLAIYIGIPLVAVVIVVGSALGFIFYHRTPGASCELECRHKLVIDHDGGADDALAITLGLLNEKYFGGPNVVALTTTFGNVNLSQAIINSDRILTLCDRQDVPIYSGAHKHLISGIESDYYFGYDGLGDDGYTAPRPVKVKKEPAAVALIELSKQYEGELIVVAIGPLTNIALAARLDPEFISRLAHLYVGGGHIYSAKNPEPEFNVDMDPEAYYIVADSAIVDKVTLVPFSQVFTSLNITKEWRTDVLGAIPTPIMRELNGFERISISTSPAWTQLDPAVMAIALNNTIVEEFRNTTNGIILCGDQRGINTNNFTSATPNAKVAYASNVNDYKQFLIDVYSAELVKN